MKSIEHNDRTTFSTIATFAKEVLTLLALFIKHLKEFSTTIA